MPPKSIPDRWLQYKSIGETITGTRFIPFKVPLKQEICQNLPKAQRFTLQHLVENVNTLGLIIDLTNTNRYYNSKELKQWDIAYNKIYVEGEKVPNLSVVKKFSSTVDDFLKNKANQGKLIGVHCTHGLNRTGYLVCRYMIDKLEKTPGDAVKAFNEARGHCIERQAYLDGLEMDATRAARIKVQPKHRGKAKNIKPSQFGHHQEHERKSFQTNSQSFYPNNSQLQRQRIESFSRRNSQDSRSDNGHNFHPYVRPFNIDLMNDAHNSTRGRNYSDNSNYTLRNNYANYGNVGANFHYANYDNRRNYNYNYNHYQQSGKNDCYWKDHDSSNSHSNDWSNNARF